MTKLIAYLSILGLLAAAASTCVPGSAQTKALDAAGISNYTLTGHSYLGCSGSGSMFTSYSFEGTNVMGQPVEGDLCCGLVFKGCNIRF